MLIVKANSLTRPYTFKRYIVLNLSTIVVLSSFGMKIPSTFIHAELMPFFSPHVSEVQLQLLCHSMASLMNQIKHYYTRTWGWLGPWGPQSLPELFQVWWVVVETWISYVTQNRFGNANAIDVFKKTNAFGLGAHVLYSPPLLNLILSYFTLNFHLIVQTFGSILDLWMKITPSFE